MAVTSYSSTPTIIVLDEMQAMLDTVTEMLDKNYHVIGVTNFGTLLKTMANCNPALFLYFINLCNFFMAHNVPVVRQGFVARKKGLQSKNRSAKM